MATILEKVSTLISANLHALVDQALQSNNLAVVDQYIRQVEDQLRELEDATTTVGGEIHSLQRTLADHQKRHDELNAAVDAFLEKGQATSAAATQSQLNNTQRLVETYQSQIAGQEAEYQKLLDARTKLETRLGTMKQQRTELQSLLELAKSKEVVVKTVKSLDDMMGSGDSDISRIAKSVYTRLDKANAAVEIHASGLDNKIDQVLEHDKIEKQLQERRERLARKEKPEKK
jgi:phage shock protein A